MQFQTHSKRLDTLDSLDTVGSHRKRMKYVICLHNLFGREMKMIMHEKKDNYNIDMGGLFSRNSTTLLSDRLLYLYGYVLEECSFCGR